jgi:hypothetical protein
LRFPDSAVKNGSLYSPGRNGVSLLPGVNPRLNKTLLTGKKVMSTKLRRPRLF